MEELNQRYQRILADINAATLAVGARSGPVRLLAVSKGQSAAAVRALYQLGQREFGENYVQEMVAKAAELKDLADLRWTYIGRVQSNKIPLIAKTAVALQSLGSERHARLLAESLRKQGRGASPYPVHILVNAGDESSKDGVPMDGIAALARYIQSELPELQLRGIMAIPPPLPLTGNGQPPELYRALRVIADQTGAGELSLGMSGDLREAIAAGSNCVRIGTALFGPRQ